MQWKKSGLLLSALCFRWGKPVRLCLHYCITWVQLFVHVKDITELNAADAAPLSLVVFSAVILSFKGSCISAADFIAFSTQNIDLIDIRLHCVYTVVVTELYRGKPNNPSPPPYVAFSTQSRNSTFLRSNFPQLWAIWSFVLSYFFPFKSLKLHLI